MICSHTRKHKIRNEVIPNKIAVAPVEDEIYESRWSLFDHVRRRPIAVSIRRVVGMKQVFSKRGEEKPRTSFGDTLLSY